MFVFEGYYDCSSGSLGDHMMYVKHFNKHKGYAVFSTHVLD